MSRVLSKSQRPSSRTWSVCAGFEGYWIVEVRSVFLCIDWWSGLRLVGMNRCITQAGHHAWMERPVLQPQHGSENINQSRDILPSGRRDSAWRDSTSYALVSRAHRHGTRRSIASNHLFDLGIISTIVAATHSNAFLTRALKWQLCFGKETWRRPHIIPGRTTTGVSSQEPKPVY